MDDWKEIQDDLRDGKYGPWNLVRVMVEEKIIVERQAYERAYEEEYGIQGISSSDINYVAYGMVRSGDLKPFDGGTFLIRRVTR
jgi:hypothetical protein